MKKKLKHLPPHKMLVANAIQDFRGTFGVGFHTRQQKIDGLIKYANMKFNVKKVALKGMRRFFLTDKRLTVIYKKPCFVCGGKAEARHHIIGLKNGGSNYYWNIIPICNYCHAEVHPWLDAVSNNDPVIEFRELVSTF